MGHQTREYTETIQRIAQLGRTAAEHRGSLDPAVRAFADRVADMLQEHRTLVEEHYELQGRYVKAASAGMFQEVLQTIAVLAKPEGESTAKNFVELALDWRGQDIKGLTFDQIVVTFMRPGGRRPTDVIDELRSKVAGLEHQLVGARALAAQLEEAMVAEGIEPSFDDATKVKRTPRKRTSGRKR